MSLNPGQKLYQSAVLKSIQNPNTGFYSFFRLAFAEIEGEELVDSWYIQYLCYVLQNEYSRISQGKPRDKNIIFLLPPLTLKTTVLNYFNAWVWAIEGKFSILTIHSNVTFAESAISKSKRIFLSDWYTYFFGHRLRRNRTRDISSNLGGNRYAVSIKGREAPVKFDLVFLDSVLGIEQSEKTLDRDRVYKSYTTRFKYALKNNDRGSFFIIQDIKHPDGLVGRLLEKKANNYRLYSLPADDRGTIHPKGLTKFYKDGLLFPERMDADFLATQELDDSKFQSRYLLRTSVVKSKDSEGSDIDRELLLNSTDVEAIRAEIERVFFPVTYVFAKNWLAELPIINNRGGTRSSKTHSICQQLVIWLFTGIWKHGEIIETGRATIVREHSVTLSLTVQKTFEESILKQYSKNGRLLYDYVEHKKVLREYHYKGRIVALMGANEGQKLRGYESDILYCNEANELEYKEQFFQLMIRTKSFITIDHNPSDPYIWINEKLEKERTVTKKDVLTIVSTYKDNPYLPQRLIDEVEYYQITDKELWRVYGLGQYGKVEGLVLTNWEIIDEMPPTEHLSKYAGWCDFGFVDPFAMGVAGMIGEDMYVDEYIYQSYLTNSKLMALADEVDYPDVYTIADSAKPGDIKEWQNGGFLFDGVHKYKGSIEHGIGLLKKVRKIYVTRRSVGILKELMKYKYIVDKNGNTLPIPMDKHNHSIDGIRYYAMEMLNDNDTPQSPPRGVVIG